MSAVPEPKSPMFRSQGFCKHLIRASSFPSRIFTYFFHQYRMKSEKRLPSNSSASVLKKPDSPCLPLSFSHEVGYIEEDGRRQHRVICSIVQTPKGRGTVTVQLLGRAKEFFIVRQKFAYYIIDIVILRVLLKSWFIFNAIFLLSSTFFLSIFQTFIKIKFHLLFHIIEHQSAWLSA